VDLIGEYVTGNKDKLSAGYGQVNKSRKERRAGEKKDWAGIRRRKRIGV
jgi:hypothetical protein